LEIAPGTPAIVPASAIVPVARSIVRPLTVPATDTVRATARVASHGGVAESAMGLATM
jgi:hypothetical protein